MKVADLSQERGSILTGSQPPPWGATRCSFPEELSTDRVAVHVIGVSTSLAWLVIMADLFAESFVSPPQFPMFR